MSYNKNAVWGNKPQGNNQLGGMSNLNHTGMAPFQQQQQVFPNMGLNQNMGLGLQQMAANQLNFASNPIFQQQLSAVSYPNTRGLNPTAFQTGQGNVQNNSGGTATKQKVFTGAVTQIHENFGFIDDEVFFSRNVCIKGSNPLVGDRVLCEATFNPSMPFKWNATRVQGMPRGHNRDQRHNQSQGDNNGFGRRGDGGKDFGGGRDNRKPSIGERRNRSRDRDDDEIERKRRREDRMREREKDDKDRKSPVRRRSRSPKARRRTRAVPRYMVQIPKITLNMSEADLLEIKKRYSNLYIPSDFFNTYIRWVDAFPADKPYALNKPCSFLIMYKELDPIVENNAVLEPADADYTFSAKVMLMSVPGIEELYQKCCSMADDKEARDRDSEDRDYIHPTRLINFLVGLRGKNETMAIGGPWSPSVDGQNPEKDPSVLIKTAIRTCKALTGIDLSNCTQWYRFVELYYRRGATTHKGKPVPARVETVVIFLPDVWSCLPTRLEWEELQQGYRKHLEKILKADAEEVDDADNVTDEKVDEGTDTLEPTLYNELNPKGMSVVDLRHELKARSLDPKGLKSQLVARLTKALKVEEEAAGEEESSEKKNSDTEEPAEKEEGQSEKDKKSEPEEKKLDEVQKRRLEKQHTLPDQPYLIVHPSKIAKSGKFDCTSMSLSLLLDYRPEDTKEHSFEVSLFAELFNEMLTRDFGFNIFKALYQVPEKPKEEDKKKKDEKKDEKKKDNKDEEKKEDNGEEESKPEESAENKNEGEEKKKEKDSKKDDRKSDSSEDEDDDGRKSTKDKKRKDRIKLVTKDKHLLLSFVYFDQTQCGYIFDKDVEELLYTLGLNLSRSQVKKIVAKAITRDSLHYRKLTDKPKDEENEDAEKSEKPDEKAIDWHDVARGNGKLLPVFKDNEKGEGKKASKGRKSVSNDGLISYQGAVVDIGKLLAQLDRSEKARIDTEQYLVDLKSENQKLSEKYSKSSSTIKHLNSEVKDYKEKLRNTEDSLGRSNAHSKLFQTTLMDIRDKIEPVLKTASHKDEKKEERKERDRDSEKKKDRDDGKSRWEKEKERDASRKESSDKDKKDDIKKETEVKKEVEVKKELKEKDNKVETKKDKKDIDEAEDIEMKEENN